MAKILIDARPLVDPLDGGVSRVARDLLTALIPLWTHHQITLLTVSWKRPPTLSFGPNVTHRHIRIPSKLWSLFSFFHLIGLDSLAPKHDHLFVFNHGFIGRPRIPYSLLVHDVSYLIEPLWYSRKSRWWHTWVHAKWQIKNAAHLFSVSPTTTRDLLYFFPEVKKHIQEVKPGFAPLPFATERPATIPSGRYLLAMGANHPRKNIGLVYSMFHLLKKDPAFQDVKLVVCNTKQISTEPDIIALHRPNKAELGALMQYASAFLFPSWYEGIGLPVQEAASFGTPILMSDGHALRDFAPTRAILLPPTKPHLWLFSLKQVLNTPKDFSTKSLLNDWKDAANTIDKILNF
jgi:glycosyltransferase involved in cell wall biosynthesis